MLLLPMSSKNERVDFFKQELQILIIIIIIIIDVNTKKQ